MQTKILVAIFLGFCALHFCILATTPDHLLTELKEARSKFQSYAVMCRVRGPMGNIWSSLPTNSNSETDVYYEWMRTNDHSVVAVRDRQRGTWRVRGISSGIRFWVDGASPVRSVPFKFESDPDYTFMRMFDPLSIGLGFRNEFENGNNFESSLKALQRWSQLPGIEPNVDVQGALAKWSYNSDTEIVFDTQHSYWPVSLTYPTHKTAEVSWTVELGQKFGVDLPVRVTLRTRSKQSEERTVVDLDWLSINDPFKLGRPSVERLNEKFGIELQYVVDAKQGTKE